MTSLVLIYSTHYFFVMAHAGMAYEHFFHSAGKFCENQHNWHVASVLVLDMYTGTFFRIKHRQHR